jgi:hypothetical protein
MSIEIEQTKKWISDVVVGCNFCPFAAREVKKNSIHYVVEQSNEIADGLSRLMKECARLDEQDDIETTIIILPNGFDDFNEYLHFVSLAEKLLKKEQYEGVYQVASFHPDYCFAGASTTDASNYTNRSIYPMLHLLREESLEQVLATFPNPDSIPIKNVEFATKKGESYMKALRNACI